MALLRGSVHMGWGAAAGRERANIFTGLRLSRKRTGSLYDVVNLGTTPASDNEWWTQDITVKGNQVMVKINDVIVLEYTEPPGAQPGKDFTRKLDAGTFALQAHDPKSIVRYRNIRVKRLD